MLDERSRISVLSSRWRFWIAVALLAMPPAALGMWAARDLHWPDDSDFFRDIAQAQSFARGHLLADPLYLGETIWYNPLVPGIVAGLSRATGTAVPVLYARAGAWLNMLAPILLAVLLARLFGAPAGLVALTVYVYGTPWAGGASTPLYSGFLYSSFFAPAIFFLTLLVFASFPDGKRRRYVLTGLLLGLTFLAHTAPFLILCVIFSVEALREAKQDWRRASLSYGLLFGAAALAAAPYLVSIVGRYHLKVLNPVPMQWNSRYSRWAALKRLPDAYTSAAGLALVALLIRGPRLARRVVCTWLAACVAFVAYTFAAAEHEWPPVVPRHHPVLYLRILQSVLLGYSAFLLWSILRRRLGRWVPAAAVEPAKWAATLGAASLVLLWALPGCIRQASDPPRTGLVNDSLLQSGMDAYRWMRSLRSDDVVLATDDRALITVGPTGAKTVAVDAIYGNLYVDAGPRLRARDDMFAALRRGDEPAFETLAEEYAVTYVLWITEDGPSFDPTPFRKLTVAFDDGKTQIYRRSRRGVAADATLRGTLEPSSAGRSGTIQAQRARRLKPMPQRPPDVTPEIVHADITEDLLQAYLAGPDVAVDTETMGLKTLRDRICLVQLCNRDMRAAIVQIPAESLGPEVPLASRAPRLKRLMEDPRVTKAFHFARFDVAALRYWLGIDVAPLYCTRTASKLARTYTDRHGLKDNLLEFLDVELDKVTRHSDWSAEQLSPQQVAYAISDVTLLLPLMDRLEAMLRKQGRSELAQECFRAIPTFGKLDIAGYDLLFEH